jgi:hypothetical protein
MTENKLRKFISKPREPPSDKRTHQPIILTDSKGIYLKKYACHDIEKQIVWLPKSRVVKPKIEMLIYHPILV